MSMFQRVMAAVAMAAVCCWGTAKAADKGEKVKFVEGVFTMTIPEGWSYEQDENALLHITDDDKSGNFLLVMPPNPALKKNKSAEFAGMLLGTMFAEQGEIAVAEEEEVKFKGFDSTNALFGVKKDGKVLIAGLINVVVIKGTTFIMITGAPAANADAFLPKAAAIMDSFEVDPKQLAAKNDVLAEIGKKLIKEVTEAAE